MRSVITLITRLEMLEMKDPDRSIPQKDDREQAMGFIP